MDELTKRVFGATLARGVVNNAMLAEAAADIEANMVLRAWISRTEHLLARAKDAIENHAITKDGKIKHTPGPSHMKRIADNYSEADRIRDSYGTWDY